ncbi:general stress protein [Bacillus sp. FJAT-42315]|uniref:general stress protein n=1 Tax=Bacillus sp. FJAT-42315 TaxID=2014077 RepID=UPI000C23D601|nr:general stress protein [Bacillus sp. FJAT-42315]
MRGRIESRFSYLYKGESSAIVMFIFLSYLANYVYPEFQLYSLYSFWASFLLLEFLLLQGSVYWYVKLKRLKTKNTSVTPIWLVQRLKKLQKVNIGLMIVGGILFVVDVLIWYPSLPTGLSVAGFIYVFACLEYINYYHIQLSYDNLSDIRYLLKSKKLKQACMSKDFKRIS